LGGAADRGSVAGARPGAGGVGVAMWAHSAEGKGSERGRSEGMGNFSKFAHFFVLVLSTRTFGRLLIRQLIPLLKTRMGRSSFLSFLGSQAKPVAGKNPTPSS